LTADRRKTDFAAVSGLPSAVTAVSGLPSAVSGLPSAVSGLPSAVFKRAAPNQVGRRQCWPDGGRR